MKKSVSMFVAMPLVLALMFVSILAFAAPATGKNVQAVQIRVSTDKGETRLTTAVGQFTRLTLATGTTIGVHTTPVEGARRYNVVVLRAASDRNPKTLSSNDFRPLERFMLEHGASASRRLSDGVVVDVVIPNGVVLETSGGEVEDCTCCVTCDNDVVICGCKVRSSCGNCG